VPDAGQRKLADAGLARPAVALQHRVGAHQPEVVQRRHHRQAEPVRRAQDGRAEQRERVVDVHHVGPPLLQ
jgi:hypothetical protein